MSFFTRTLAAAAVALIGVGSAEAESLVLTVGQAHRAPARGTVANVVVVDPTVADVTVIDQHSVVILAKSTGVTDVLVTDRGGRILMSDRIVVASPAEEGRMTLFRGLLPSDYDCMRLCLTMPLETASTGSAVANGEAVDGRSQAPARGASLAAPAPAPHHP